MSLQEKILKRKLKKKERQKLKVIEERKTAKLEEEDSVEDVDENEPKGVKRKLEETEPMETEVTGDSEAPDSAAPTEKKKKKKKKSMFAYRN